MNRAAVKSFVLVSLVSLPKFRTGATTMDESSSPKKLSIVTVPLVDLLATLLEKDDSLMDDCTLTLTSLQGTQLHPDFTPAIRSAIQRYIDARASTQVDLVELEDLVNKMRLQKLIVCLRSHSSSPAVKAFPWGAQANKLIHNHDNWQKLHQETHRRLTQQQKALAVLRDASMVRFQSLLQSLKTVQTQVQSILSLPSEILLDAHIPVAPLKQLYVFLKKWEAAETAR